MLKPCCGLDVQFSVSCRLLELATSNFSTSDTPSSTPPRTSARPSAVALIDQSQSSSSSSSSSASSPFLTSTSKYIVRTLTQQTSLTTTAGAATTETTADTLISASASSSSASSTRSSPPPPPPPLHPLPFAPLLIDRSMSIVPGGMSAPLVSDEHLRLEAVRALGLLDVESGEEIDKYQRVVDDLCDELRVPIAAISLVDEERQYFVAQKGLPVRQTDRDCAFCAHAIWKPATTMVVLDALKDVRFAENELVLDIPDIRFYAGCPLLDPSGQFAVGTLCAIDTVRHEEFTEDEQQRLQRGAARVQNMFNQIGRPQQQHQQEHHHHQEQQQWIQEQSMKVNVKQEQAPTS